MIRTLDEKDLAKFIVEAPRLWVGDIVEIGKDRLNSNRIIRHDGTNKNGAS